MLNINDIIYESLSDHFKKHWKKYALGLGSAALASGGGYLGYKKYKDKKKEIDLKNKEIKRENRNKFLKKALIGTGIATGAALAGTAAHQGYYKYKVNSLKKQEIELNKDMSDFYHNLNTNNMTPEETVNHLNKKNEFNKKLGNIMQQRRDAEKKVFFKLDNFLK